METKFTQSIKLFLNKSQDLFLYIKEVDLNQNAVIFCCVINSMKVNLNELQKQKLVIKQVTEMTEIIYTQIIYTQIIYTKIIYTQIEIINSISFNLNLVQVLT